MAQSDTSDGTSADFTPHHLHRMLVLTHCISKSTGHVRFGYTFRTYFGRFSDGLGEEDEAGDKEGERAKEEVTQKNNERTASQT